MIRDLTALHPDYSGSLSIGILSLEGAQIQRFEWQGIHWTGTLALQQLALFLYALLVIVVAAICFRRFQEAPITAKTGSRRKKSAAGADQTSAANSSPEYDWDGIPQPSGSALHAGTLTPVSVRESLLPLVFAECRLMLKGTALGWYNIAIALLLLGLFLPPGLSAAWMILPLTWIWPLILWSGMGSREYRYQTRFLVAASPRYVFRQLTAVWLAGWILTCTTGSGMLLRLILEGDLGNAVHWLAAAIFIPSLALAAGVLTRTSRTFEVLYMILWYIGPFNKVPSLDFIGIQSAAGAPSWMLSLLYTLISGGLLLAAYLSRSRLMRTT